MEIGGLAVPVTRVNTVIVGAGAAGMNCAVQLVNFWRSRGVAAPHEHVAVVTGGLGLGASRMSGSDKQTYYKMGTSPRVADTAEEFARALTGFGCCHGDNALVEGICSLRGFYNLVEAGVPFPHDPDGAFIGYKTDHDPYERATSAGPKTSRFMSHCLQARAQREGLAIIDRHPVLKFVTQGASAARRIVAMVCADMSRASANDPGLAIFAAENWVLAAGGPGEIYKTTVYPRGQYGLHGAALEAGLEACNLTESQYGLASIKFRWNVSGTYMQVIPRIYSTDADGGDQREFLTEYFEDMSSMATNIFLKGYQWPFDAQRIPTFDGQSRCGGEQSSLVDMAVHQETVVRGRRVWMDFLRNPVGADGWDEFDINSLGTEALEYLEKTGAMQAAPIERLAHMNVPAIEIYAENGIDLRAEPLEIAVCAQHMNGGFAVDKWWRSNVQHAFVIGEMAGTHGVKRPGGSALNAGQVGATRAAEYIANVHPLPSDDDAPVDAAGAAAAVSALTELLSKGALAPKGAGDAMAEICERMTRYGAHLRGQAGAREALAAGVAQYRAMLNEGLATGSARQLAEVVRTMQQCLTHVAILKAICAMFERGAGSRGSHCILADDGPSMHAALTDPTAGEAYRFRAENESLRDEILNIRYDADAGDLFDVRLEAPRPIPDRDVAFEPAWADFREGSIYDV